MSEPAAGHAKTARSFSLGLLLVMLFAGPVGVDEIVDIDLDALMDETQWVTPDPDRVGFVWWLPTEFWQASLAADPLADLGGTDAIVEVMDPYIVIAVADGTIGPFGGTTFLPEPDLRKSLRIQDTDGNSYAPLSQEASSADARNLLGMMRPGLAGMLGPMGENMHFFLFASRAPDGRRIADPRQAGRLSVTLGGVEGLKTLEHTWRLPLGSVLPPRWCPEDGERLSGAWRYCPFDGSELVEKRPK
jgi:hypothetical protein